ncbi:MAG: hypothetical protein EA338_00285 [Roseinatronobacter sp.]|nr:MAG: hypothetical protein EA338_00285 [Roseinatronobacter sp.]
MPFFAFMSQAVCAHRGAGVCHAPSIYSQSRNDARAGSINRQTRAFWRLAYVREELLGRMFFKVGCPYT